MANEAGSTYPGVADVSGALNTSGVSWGAIFAGAAAAAALSLILLILGFGFGLSSISPWANTGARATTIGISTILWLSITQILASGMGGYLSGRLRVKWQDVHDDEVYFRDTAHGFLAWAVASIVTAAFLASAISSAVGGALEAGASATSVAAVGAAASQDKDKGNSSTVSYFVDALYRADQPVVDSNDAATRAESARIFITDLHANSLPAADKQYLGRLVAKHSGLSQADAEARVTDVFNRAAKTLADVETSAKEAADKARKAAAYSALWMFIALLLGAFFASLAATFGGRERDRVKVRRAFK